MRRLSAATLLLYSAIPLAAKERKWLPAEVASIKETQVEMEEMLYKSSQPNNSMDGPLRSAGVERQSKKVYTYVFTTSATQLSGRAEKKPLEGLAEGMKVDIFRQRGWLLIRMPDGKEKRLDFIH